MRNYFIKTILMPIKIVTKKIFMISNIPFDVFFNNILGEIYIEDICHLCMTCKSFEKYLNVEEVWKKCYLVKKIDQYMENKQLKLINSPEQLLVTYDWSYRKRQLNRCTMIVINYTDIPYTIYWVKKKRKGKHGLKDIRIHELSPKETFCTTTFPSEKWFCLPHRSWLLQNPYSNYGFSWIINIFDQKEVFFENSKKTAFVKEIFVPKISNPIKGTHKNYKDYKRQLIRLWFKDCKDKKRIDELINIHQSDELYFKNEYTRQNKELQYLKDSYLHHSDRVKILQCAKKF